MPSTITVLPDRWMTTAEVAQAIGKAQTAVLEMARDGRLKAKQGMRTDQPKAWLFDPESVRQYIPDGPKPEPTSAALAKREARKSALLRPSQSERALDTVSIVGTLAINHKSEMEMIVSQMSRNFENLLNVVLTSQKAEADANRERLKAEREDARERWEIERQDRLERRKNRDAGPVAVKTRKAHA